MTSWWYNHESPKHNEIMRKFKAPYRIQPDTSKSLGILQQYWILKGTPIVVFLFWSALLKFVSKRPINNKLALV